ncbi:hypothetical protein D3C71_1695370 [compost metagenome]
MSVHPTPVIAIKLVAQLGFTSENGIQSFQQHRLQTFLGHDRNVERYLDDLFQVVRPGKTRLLQPLLDDVTLKQQQEHHIGEVHVGLDQLEQRFHLLRREPVNVVHDDQQRMGTLDQQRSNLLADFLECQFIVLRRFIEAVGLVQ